MNNPQAYQKWLEHWHAVMEHKFADEVVEWLRKKGNDDAV
jgi:hypothetical protein